MKTFQHIVGRIGAAACLALVVTQMGCLVPRGLPFPPPGLPRPPGLGSLNPFEAPAVTVAVRASDRSESWQVFQDQDSAVDAIASISPDEHL